MKSTFLFLGEGDLHKRLLAPLPLNLFHHKRIIRLC